MKPIRLTMVAFGSFPEKEVIQFDALGESPLFLINGPTGSGKTTILDAICFALYGETTGEEREARQMRCDFAHGDTLTEVALVFELAGQRYHIRRVPEQLRPKARGEGTTTHAPEAQLWKLKGKSNGADDVEAVDIETVDIEIADESEVIVSNKVKDATLAIEKITGLTVNQFRQVMVLPQGKFRQLLLAESKDREHIFGKLFQTDIYKKLEDKLKQKANAIAREVGDKQQLQQGVLEGAGLVDVDALDATLIEDKAALVIVVEKKKSLQEAVQNIEKQHQQEQTLEGLFQQLERTQKTVDELMSRQEEFSLQRVDIQMAEGAERIQPVDIELQRYLEELKKTEVALCETQKQLVEAESRQREMDALKNNAKADLVTLDDNKKKQTYLESLQSRAQDFSQAQQAELSAKNKQKIIKQQLEKASAACKAAEHNQQLVLADVATLQDKVEVDSELPLQHASWHKTLELKQQSESLLKDVATQETSLALLKEQGGKCKVAADTAIENTQRLTLAWHQGQAAVLAKALNEGEPCMVCGSLDHPVPAHLDSVVKRSEDKNTDNRHTVPSDEQLAAARQKEQQCQEQLLSAREKYAQQAAQIKSVKQQISALCETLGSVGVASVTAMHAEMERLTISLKQWQQDKERLRAAQQRVSNLRSSEQHLISTLDVARAEEVQAQSHYAAALAVLHKAAEELPEEYRVQGALQSHIQRVTNMVVEAEKRQQQVQQQWEAAAATCHTLLAQKQERQSAQKNVNEQCDAARQRWYDVLLASPFDSDEQYRSYQLDQHQLHEMKQSLLAYEQSLTENRGVLKQQKEQLVDSARPVLSGSHKQLQLAKQAYNTVDTEWLVLDKRVSLLLSTQKTLRQMQVQMQELEDSFALFGTLSNVANGQTYEKISLQRFVLGVLLDDVLIEASQRLSLMSKGRYLLLRKTEKSKGNKASGLELVVDDAYTGVQRPVATLSGGESFMAALSLALGLSDVVQAYSGGIRLDMLFIDEGFGSLDPESLELAIRTLLDLQKAGRMVGVISHVSDLKDQIPLRLDVVASHRGSHTELVGVIESQCK